MRKLHVFVSSPGDVVEERVVTRRVLERLGAVYGDRVELVPVFWEHEPLRASASFQDQIRQPADCDVVLMILWSRLGTRLPTHMTRPDGSRYASGTEFEFENALESYRAKGTPDLLVYRKTARPVTPLDTEQQILKRLRQKEALDGFVERWFMAEDGSFTAAFHTFEGLDDYEELLETHLRKLLREKIPDSGQDLRRRVDWTHGSPYRGLEVFGVEHTPIFFGRTRATSEVLNALRRQSVVGRPFVLVLGMSGCGKSSLLRAGVLPLLTQPGVIEGVGLWRSAVMRPADAGSDLFSSLAAALVQDQALPELMADGTGIAALAKQFQESPEVISALIKGGLSQAAGVVAREDNLEQQTDARLVLLIDQLEELFTTPGVSGRERDLFVAAIESLVASGKVWVLATMRSDFYSRLAELPGLVALKEGAGQYDLLPPSPAEIGQMIRRPAELAGLEFEESEVTGERLDDALRDAAARNPEALPLLQFTLEQLYTARSVEEVLTLAAYTELGGVEGALAQRAEAAFSSLPEPAQAAFSAVMSSLVTVGAGESDGGTRQRAPLAGFAGGSPGRVLVDRFVEARLLVTDRDDRGEPVVAVAHEALLRYWPRMVQWLERNRELLQVRERLDAAARQWDTEGRPASNLLASAKRLAEADELEKSEEIELPEREHEFLQASLAKGRRTQRLKRTAGAALFILAVVAAGAAFFAEAKRQEAEVARGESEAVTGFLGDMLASVDPEELGREVLVRDVLDEASTKMDELQGQPLIQARLMNTMGNVYSSLGLYEEAQPLLEMGLEVREKELGPNDLAVAQSLNELGSLLREKGEFEQVKGLLERALAIRESVLGPDDPAVADTLRALGNLSWSMGDFEGSKRLFEQAVEIYEKAPERNSDELAKTLNNLGLSSYQLAEYEEAHLFLERSIAMHQELFGADHLSQSPATGNLGMLLKRTGDREGAQAMYERVISINEKALGPHHPELAFGLSNLAVLHATGGEFDKALPLFERVLQIREKALGPDHPAVGGAVVNVGILHAQKGQFQTALPYFQRGAAIKEKSLGPNHPDVANDLNNLATLYIEMGQLEKAQPLYERALAIREEALGSEHPDTALTVRDLAELLVKLGDLERPGPLFQRALEIQEKALGPEQPEVATTLRGFGMLLQETGEFQDARLTYERSLVISTKSLGADHPEVAMSHHLLAGLLMEAGENAESEAQYQRAIEIREEKLGPDHPHVADSLEGYAELLHETGRDEEARTLQIRAHLIRQSMASGDEPNT
jgi:tetratricopeptide (TPR) repeat protein